jgi:hypothetical protein
MPLRQFLLSSCGGAESERTGGDMAEMQFRLTFLVGESGLGPVMASLYRSSHISELEMIPVEQLKALPKPTAKNLAQATIDAATDPIKASATDQPGHDSDGKQPRKGRNPKGKRLADALLAALRKGPMQTSDLQKIVETQGYVKNGLFSCLHRLVAKKRVVKLQPGLYGLTPVTPSAETPNEPR